MAPVSCKRRQGRGRSRYCEVRNLSVEHRGAGNFARNYFGCIQGLTGISYIMLFCHNTFCWFGRHILKYILQYFTMHVCIYYTYVNIYMYIYIYTCVCTVHAKTSILVLLSVTYHATSNVAFTAAAGFAQTIESGSSRPLLNKAKWDG